MFDKFPRVARLLFAAGLGTSVAACTAVTDDTFATLKYAFQRGEDVQLTPEQVAEFPYTALYAKWQDAPQILVVLGYIDGDSYSWVTAERETLVTEYGRVVRTAGVDFDLAGVSNLAADPLRCIVTTPTQCNLSWQRAIDVHTSGQLYSRTVVSDFSVQGRTAIQLAAGEYQVTHVVEHGVVGLGEQPQSTFINEFWLQDDGHVIKSHQHIVPERPRITIEQMKWVGR